MLKRIMYGVIGLFVAIGGCFLMAWGIFPPIFLKIAPARVFTKPEFWGFLTILALFCLFFDVIFVFIKTRTLVWRVIYGVTGFIAALGVCLFIAWGLLNRIYWEIPLGIVLSSPVFWGLLSLVGWSGLFFAALFVVFIKKTMGWRLIYVFIGLIFTVGVCYLIPWGILNEFSLIASPRVIISGPLFWGLFVTLGGLYFFLPTLSISIKGKKWGSVPNVLEKLISVATWQRNYRYFSINLPIIMRKLWTTLGKSRAIWQRKVIRYPLVATGILAIYAFAMNGLLAYMPNTFASYPYIEPPVFKGYYLGANSSDLYHYLNPGTYDNPIIDTGQEIIIKNVDLSAVYSKTETYFICDSIQFMALYPRQLKYLKNDDVIDVIGIFGGYSKEYAQHLIINNCVFAPAGLVALPLPGGPLVVVGGY